jgi:hypothetical protein
MAKKTIRISDVSGAAIQDGNGAVVRITFADARKGVRELNMTDAQAEKLGGRQTARRGRRPEVGADELGVSLARRGRLQRHRPAVQAGASGRSA